MTISQAQAIQLVTGRGVKISEFFAILGEKSEYVLEKILAWLA